MNERQALALAHPINRADEWELLDQLTYLDALPGGLQLCTVLAIDR